MNIMALTTSKSALFVLFILCACYPSVVGLSQMMEQLQHSLFPLWPLCWYSSNVAWLHSKCRHALLSLQVNSVFLAITLKVLLSRRTSMSAKVTSNKDTAKYACNYA